MRSDDLSNEPRHRTNMNSLEFQMNLDEPGRDWLWRQTLLKVRPGPIQVQEFNCARVLAGPSHEHDP